MSRISSIVSTPVSDRIKIFDKSPASPRRIPPKSTEKPRREVGGLETPKLRPVPRSQFLKSVEVPAAVKPYLTTKLAPTPPKIEQSSKPAAVVKVDLKPVPSDKSESRGAAVRSSSAVR